MMNEAWHKKHVLPKGASLEARIAWHREHQKRCACRSIPPKLLDQMGRDRAFDEYLAKVNPRSRALLNELRKKIHAIVPHVEECISYRLPAFRATRGKSALHFDKPLPTSLVRKLLAARIAEGRRAT